MVTFSDHTPITANLFIPLLPHKQTNWKLNDSLLSNPVDVSALTLQLQQFFADSDAGDISLSLRWEAHKAFMHGKLIELGSP